MTNSATKWLIIAGVTVSTMWMRIPHAVQILLILMGLDIVSGIFAAISSKSLNSSIMVRGLFKKLAVFPLLALLHVVEEPLHLPFEFESIGAIAFIVYEAMSIIENCANTGVPIPAVIVNVLAKAKIPTATPDEIKKEFTDQTAITVSKTSTIIKTPDSLPDIKVDKTVTVIEQNHESPVQEEQK